MQYNYFYENRDPYNEGLVYIYHNWESGTDNSPMWDAIFETMNSPEYTFERRDTAHVDASQRPSKREYDHYLYILEIAKEHHYNDQKIAEFSPFLVQDPLFNSMLIKSNQSLIELYSLIGNNQEKVDLLKKWQEKSIKNFNKKLFDKELGAYIHYDLRNDKPLKYISSSSFSPLFAGIPSQERAQILINTLNEKFGGAAAAQINTFSGATEQLSNTFGDLLEEIGFLITRSPFVVQAVKSLEGVFKVAIAEVQEFAKSLESQLAAMTSEYQQSVENYQANESTYTDLVKQDKIAEITGLEQRIQSFQQNAQQALQSKEQELHRLD